MQGRLAGAPANAARPMRECGRVGSDCRRRRRQGLVTPAHEEEEARRRRRGGGGAGAFPPAAASAAAAATTSSSSRSSRRRRPGVVAARASWPDDAPAREDDAAPAYLSAREPDRTSSAAAAAAAASQGPPPMVRVRFHVHYRVHSRQMLCIGGSQIPFGWSFLSIAKVPMTWNEGDVWTCEVDLPAGDGGPGGATAATSSARPPLLEYKYVVLEEQDWTALRDDASEGLVPPAVTYRTTAAGGGPASRPPPDSKSIARKMAIVAWQPGPNRALAMPTTAELAALVPGVAVERAPARPTSGGAGTGPGGLGEWQQQGGGGAPPQPPPPPAWDPSSASARDPYEGTWEVLSLKPDPEAGGQLRPRLDRHDVWGYFPSKAGGGGPPTQPPPGDGGAGAGGGGAGGGSNGQQGSQRPPGLPRFGI